MADNAARLFMHFKQFGIEKDCVKMIQGLKTIFQMQGKTMTKAEYPQVYNMEKLIYVKAISYTASIALERPIGLVTAEYMYEVLIEDDDNDFKRMHGKDFPSELTDAGWRSSFKAINDYVSAFID